MKIKIGLSLVLILCIATAAWFILNKDNSISLLGKLTFQPFKVPTFNLDGQQIVENQEAGITYEMMRAYVDKNVDLRGKIITITIGASGPDCSMTQIGCERAIKVVLPNTIKVIE